MRQSIKLIKCKKLVNKLYFSCSPLSKFSVLTRQKESKILLYLHQSRCSTVDHLTLLFSDCFRTKNKCLFDVTVLCCVRDKYFDVYLLSSCSRLWQNTYRVCVCVCVPGGCDIRGGVRGRPSKQQWLQADGETFPNGHGGSGWESALWNITHCLVFVSTPFHLSGSLNFLHFWKATLPFSAFLYFTAPRIQNYHDEW